MLVSIVMVTFKQHKYIREAIDSILNQTYKNIELIIVLVYGDKETLDIINTYKDTRIKIVLSNYAMITHQMNLGCFAATGKYSMLFASDDILYQDSIEKLVSFAEKHNAVIVYPDYDIGDDNLNLLRIDKCEEHSKEAIKKNCYITDVSFVLRDCFIKYIPMKFKHGRKRIWKVWINMSKNNEYKDRIKHYNLTTFMYRQHKKNIHNHGSQNELKNIVIGDNISLINDVASIGVKHIRPEEIGNNDFCVYIVSPKYFVKYNSYFINKRIICHWKNNTIGYYDSVNKCYNFNQIYNVTYDKNVFNFLKCKNSVNTMLMADKNKLFSFITEEDYSCFYDK